MINTAKSESSRSLTSAPEVETQCDLILLIVPSGMVSVRSKRQPSVYEYGMTRAITKEKIRRGSRISQMTYCRKPKGCEMRHAVQIREEKKRKGADARGSPEIVWTAGPPNDRRGETEAHREDEKERTGSIGMIQYRSMSRTPVLYT